LLLTSKQTKEHYCITENTMEQLKKNNCIKYAELLKQAYVTTSRKEALHLIHEADKLRMEMSLEPANYPIIYGN